MKNKMLHIEPSRIYIEQADNVQLAEHVSCRYVDYSYDLEQKIESILRLQCKE